MTPTLTALHGFLLALQWAGQPGFTYTVQLSDDLLDWQSLPYVFSGDDGALDLTIESAPPRGFARLRSSANGDTNENGLPDQWEWTHFGRIDVDPQADPDQDGWSNFEEWQNGTDPRDAFNGVRPAIVMANGGEWRVPAGAVSQSAVNLTLLHPSGEPWPDAPVEIRAASGEPRLLQAGDPTAEAVQVFTAYTDQLGRIQPDLHAIHYWAEDDTRTFDRIEITAGPAACSVDIYVLPSGSGTAPPRELRREAAHDGAAGFAWRGDPSQATGFRVEELGPDGEWIERLSVPAGELPPPDPDTGVYWIPATVTN
jgi:hypothetical protein